MSKYWYVIRGVNPIPWTAPEVSVGRKKGGGFYPQVYSSAELKNYQEAIKEEILGNYPDAPIIEDEIGLTFYFWRQIAVGLTGSGKRSRTHDADATNLQKSTEDALQGVLFKNDRQVVHAESWIMAQTDATEPLIVVGIDWHPKRPSVEVESGIDLFGEDYTKIHKSDVTEHDVDPTEFF